MFSCGYPGFGRDFQGQTNWFRGGIIVFSSFFGLVSFFDIDKEISHTSDTANVWTGIVKCLVDLYQRVVIFSSFLSRPWQLLSSAKGVTCDASAPAAVPSAARRRNPESGLRNRSCPWVRFHGGRRLGVSTQPEQSLGPILWLKLSGSHA